MAPSPLCRRLDEAWHVGTQVARSTGPATARVREGTLGPDTISVEPAGKPAAPPDIIRVGPAGQPGVPCPVSPAPERPRAGLRRFGPKRAPRPAPARRYPARRAPRPTRRPPAAPALAQPAARGRPRPPANRRAPRCMGAASGFPGPPLFASTSRASGPSRARPSPPLPRSGRPSRVLLGRRGGGRLKAASEGGCSAAGRACERPRTPSGCLRSSTL
jgi:translation initiation factor IF-2